MSPMLPTSSTQLLDVLAQELRPYPGRLAASLRMAVACMLTVAVAMSQQIPEAALSCYLIFFASRKDAGAGLAIAAGLIVAATVGIGLGVIFLELAADEPMLRLGLLALFTFGGMYFSQASRLGPMAGTVGFVFAFVMTLYDIVPVPELLSRALAWMWLVVFVPMASLVLINIAFGPNPAKLLRAGISSRLDTAARLLAGNSDAHSDAHRLLREGTKELDGFGKTGKLIGFISGDDASRLLKAAKETNHLLSLLVGRTTAYADHRGRAAIVHMLANAVGTNKGVPPLGVRIPGNRIRDGIDATIRRIADALNGSGPSQNEAGHDHERLVKDDAFTNPDYLRFALKALLAVLVTYIIYTAWGWFDIHTAMITVFYIALGTAGETLHKATLRIAGCLIGAAMGVGTIVFFMPHMTDIGHLLLVIGTGSLIAAWVSNGSERTQYMGWQMALAFFLCVLPGYGPTFDTAAASNRVTGIVLGNLVVAAIFLNIWPVSVSRKLAETLASAVEVLRTSLAGHHPPAVAAVPLAAESKRLAELTVFEPKRISDGSIDLARLVVISHEIEEAAHLLTNLRALQQTPHYLAGAPKSVKSATVSYETALIAFLTMAKSAIVNSEVPVGRPVGTVMQDLDMRFARVARLAKTRRNSRVGWMRDVSQTALIYRALQKVIERSVGSRVATEALR